MWFDRYSNEDDTATQTKVARLENFHRRHHGLLLGGLFSAFMLFIAWAMVSRIDQVTRATGEVIASSRVQVIQAVDGGVLAELGVREGDRVKPGQLLARLDQTRLGAAEGEVAARLYALKARAVRLRAEVTGAPTLVFPADFPAAYEEQVAVERALFRQRRQGLQEELRTMQVAVTLSNREQALVNQLLKSGDVSSSEVLRAERGLNEANAKLINRKNKFLEDSRLELARAEDEIAQNAQILTRRQQERADSVFTAQVDGIVKNVRITTVGGVLRAGEEIMQIVPLNDDLIIEAKVRPSDIAQVHAGLPANVRFDPFDYTIYGAVEGKVIYVSADTLKEDTQRGQDIYYRVHVSANSNPVTSTTGKQLEILPGMTAQVDIRTGDRTVMDYLLKPLRKTLTEGLGER
jgi:adhesin transport system membrane fusion protein